MAISDLFSASFLFSVAIIIILIGGIFAYVSYRMSEQDHKLTSMVQLVSLLAKDLNFVKNKIILLEQNTEKEQEEQDKEEQYISNMNGGKDNFDLISVSDGEYKEDDLEDDLEDNLEDDLENNLDDDVDDDDSCNSSCVSDDDLEDINVLNLSLTNPDVINIEDIEDLETQEEEHKDDDHGQKDASDIKTINFEEIPEVTNDTFNFKNITFTDLSEGDKELHSSKYQKLSLNKLREVVVSKGLVSDASKLKKQELLKIINVDSE